jgi:hypothetical protein
MHIIKYRHFMFIVASLITMTFAPAVSTASETTLVAEAMRAVNCRSLTDVMQFFNSAPAQASAAMTAGDITPTTSNTKQPPSWISSDFKLRKPVDFHGARVVGISSHFGMLPAMTLYLKGPVDGVSTMLESDDAKLTCKDVPELNGTNCSARFPVPSEEAQGQKLELTVMLVTAKKGLPLGRAALACTVLPVGQNPFR